MGNDPNQIIKRLKKSPQECSGSRPSDQLCEWVTDLYPALDKLVEMLPLDLDEESREKLEAIREVLPKCIGGARATQVTIDKILGKKPIQRSV